MQKFMPFLGKRKEGYVKTWRYSSFDTDAWLAISTRPTKIDSVKKFEELHLQKEEGTVIIFRDIAFGIGTNYNKILYLNNLNKLVEYQEISRFAKST